MKETPCSTGYVEHRYQLRGLAVPTTPNPQSTSTDDASDLVRGLLQASINAGLQAEMDHHLSYGYSDRKTKTESGMDTNHRNGSYTKTVDSGYGPLEVTMPRDRAGTFTPQMVPKGSRRAT